MKRIEPTLLIAAFAIALLISALSNPFFLQPDNIQNLSRNVGFILIFALAQMLPILVRGLDLSQGGLVAMVSVGAAILSNTIGFLPACAVCLAASLAFGIAQGFLAGPLALPAFVVTLGGGSLLTGLALIWSNGQTIFDVPPDFRILGWSNPFDVPLVFIVAMAALFFLYRMLGATVFGREVYAVGSSPKAALIIGVRNDTVAIACYALCSLITCIGALFLTSRITSGSPVLGNEIALQSIAAVVIGGVSLAGGRGHPFGVLFGAISLALLANLLNLYNVSSYWQSVLFGGIIILAASIDRLRTQP